MRQPARRSQLALPRSARASGSRSALVPAPAAASAPAVASATGEVIVELDQRQLMAVISQLRLQAGGNGTVQFISTPDGKVRFQATGQEARLGRAQTRLWAYNSNAYREAVSRAPRWVEEDKQRCQDVTKPVADDPTVRTIVLERS